MRVNSYCARSFRASIKAGHGPSYGQRGSDSVFQRSNAALAGKAARERHDDEAPYCSATYWLVVVARVAGLARGAPLGRCRGWHWTGLIGRGMGALPNAAGGIDSPRSICPAWLVALPLWQPAPKLGTSGPWLPTKQLRGQRKRSSSAAAEYIGFL